MKLRTTIIWLAAGLIFLPSFGLLNNVQSSGKTAFKPVWQKGITYTHLDQSHNNLRSIKSRDSLYYLRRKVQAE